MKTYKQLVEEACPKISDVITDSEAQALVTRFKKVFASIGVDFNISYHGGLQDRLTDPRNRPPISKCEFDKVLTAFIKKMSKQLISDVADIRNGTVKPRGKNIQGIRADNYEYGIKSKSTGIALILALQPNRDRRSKYPVRVNIITIMRKPKFIVNQGETVMVEGVQYDPEWIDVD